MTRPSETEIRAASGVYLDDSGAATDLCDALFFAMTNPASALLWDEQEFRPSEQQAWATMADAASDRIRPQLLELLRPAVVELLAAFAAAHPDAPRAAREAVAA